MWLHYEAGWVYPTKLALVVLALLARGGDRESHPSTTFGSLEDCDGGETLSFSRVRDGFSATSIMALPCRKDPHSSE